MMELNGVRIPLGEMDFDMFMMLRLVGNVLDGEGQLVIGKLVEQHT